MDATEKVHSNKTKSRVLQWRNLLARGTYTKLNLSCNIHSSMHKIQEKNALDPQTTFTY